MLQIQDAVKNSLEALGSVYPSGDVREPRLEEVTLSDDEQFWLVTISFTNPDYDAEREDSTGPSSLGSLLFQLQTPKRRLTKTIKFNALSGKLLGIKSRWES